MRSGKMRHSNSTWSLSAWTNHYNKRKRKSSPEEPPEPTRRPSLVETVYDINRIDAKGRSLLFYAAQCDQPEVAVQLINAGCDANIADHHGNTPLHEAAEYGHIEILNLLIEKGKCRLNPINALGQTPLMKAVANDNLQICKILIKAGCDKDSLDHLNRSALLIGLREGSEDSVLYLLKSGSNVNIVDGEGHSALYYAVFSTYLTSLLIAKKLMHTNYCLRKDVIWVLGTEQDDNSLFQTDKKFHKSILSKAVHITTTGVQTRKIKSEFLSRLRHAFRTSSSSRSSPSSSMRSSRTSSICSEISE